MEGANYEEITYEGYGPAGVAVTVDVLTDNRNRAAAAVRHEFSKHGGNLGETGCVGWMFKNKGVFVVSNENADEETLMDLVLEAGADDMQAGEEDFEITCDPAAFDDIEKALEEKGIATEVAHVTNVPDTTIALDATNGKKLENLIDALEDIDDVQEVYHNGDLPDDMEEE